MNALAITDEDLIVIGRIVSVHGIRGEVKVHSYTDPIENVLDYRHWTLRRDDEIRQAELIAGRSHGRGITAKLKDLDDRDQARELFGFDICIPRQMLPVLNDGEYYWYQLEGLRVIDQQDRLLGRIDHLMETGANDVMVVKPCPGSHDGQERLLPYIYQCVKSVDLSCGEMRVDWDVEF